MTMYNISFKKLRSMLEEALFWFNFGLFWFFRHFNA